VPNRPRALELGMAAYLIKKRLIKREQRFPVTLMLEPLEICNLACHGCGRIREYEHVFHKRMEVEECLRVAEEAGAPIVNIPGGEPMIHKQIDEIVNGITAQGRFVYMCTNGLLMNRAFGRIPPTSHFAFVVHIDGMRAVHDKAVDREGVFDTATAYMREAIELGYRVCTNTTIYRGVDPEEYVELFRFLKAMGVEGCITAPGFDYESVTHDREQFLAKREAQELYSRARALRPHGHPLLQQPPLPRVPPVQAQLSLHRVGDADLHGRGLAQPVLPTGRQARHQPQGALRRDGLGRVWDRPRPAVRELPHALRL
jgi:hopanoid biosynthesis associated radical SAM protein HpnH